MEQVDRWIRDTLVRLIGVYQVRLSPALGRGCVYRLTCSRYAVRALRRQPLPTALVTIATRLWNCDATRYRRDLETLGDVTDEPARNLRGGLTWRPLR